MGDIAVADRPPGQVGRVLMLAPSHGRGGGIERCLESLEWALAARGVACQRVDLARPGVSGHGQLLVTARAALRTRPEPTRLVVGHRALLPVASLLATERSIHGMSVLCHGSEVWDARFQPRRRIERGLVRRLGVRVIAVSSFTAGALASNCRATVLPPALSSEWFSALVDAASAVRERPPGIRLATAFRLQEWRNKGLPQLVGAVAALNRPDIRLTVCGSGDPPPDLLRLVSQNPWCTLRVGLADSEFASELAAADLFALATRTRAGRRACGEGFGLVLLEAQVAGTPVIAPAYGGSRDSYIEGVTGSAPADETTEALVRGLGGLIADPARLAWMGCRAAAWAREVFAPERYAELVVTRLL